MLTKNTFQDFLSRTPSQKEVTLAIAGDDNELSEFIKELDKGGFQNISSVFKYEDKKVSSYLIINSEEMFKETYDFVCQYPLTIISLFNTKESKTITIKPNYEKPIVLLITKKALQEMQKAGFDLLGRIGMAYQS